MLLKQVFASFVFRFLCKIKILVILFLIREILRCTVIQGELQKSKRKTKKLQSYKII